MSSISGELEKSQLFVCYSFNMSNVMYHVVDSICCEEWGHGHQVRVSMLPWHQWECETVYWRQNFYVKKHSVKNRGHFLELLSHFSVIGCDGKHVRIASRPQAEWFFHGNSIINIFYVIVCLFKPERENENMTKFLQNNFSDCNKIEISTH